MRIQPSSLASDGTPAKTGIVVVAVPGDASFGAQVQRTTDPGTTGTEVSLGQQKYVAPAGTPLLDVLPLDGVLRYYRGRAVDAAGGFAPSSWTPWTTGHTPVVVPPDYLARAVLNVGVYPLALNSSNLALSAGAALSTVASSSGVRAIVKDYITSYADFMVAVTTWMADQVAFTSGYLGYTTAITGAPSRIRAPIHPPVGVLWSTSTGTFGATVYMPPTTSAGVANCLGINLLYAKTSAPTTWLTLAQGLINYGAGGGGTSGGWFETPPLSGIGTWAIEPYTVSTDEMWQLEVAFPGAGVCTSAAQDFRVARVWAKYKQPSYDATR